MSLGFMSHVDFKKWQCRPVEVKGQGHLGYHTRLKWFSQILHFNRLESRFYEKMLTHWEQYLRPILALALK